MNRAFLLVLGPTLVIAVGYVFVLRAMGIQPPYWKLAAVVVMLGLVFWWIGRKSKRSQQLK